MRYFLLNLLVILMPTSPLQGIDRAGAQHFSITEDETAQVKRWLDAYEEKALGFEDLTVGRLGEDGCRKLVAYYLSFASSVPPGSKLPISSAFASFDMNAQAARLASDYVTVYSNDWRGWRVLGRAHRDLANLEEAVTGQSDMKNLKEAVNAYTHAVKLGDKDSCAILAALAIDAGQLDLVRNMVPDLLKLQRDGATSKRCWIQLTGVLVLYSVRTERQDLFVKALEGGDPKTILSQKDLKEHVERGCRKFKGKDIEKISEGLRRATLQGGGENEK
jgi:hypothetical protein